MKIKTHFLLNWWKIAASILIIVGKNNFVMFIYLNEVPSESSEWYHPDLGYGLEETWSKERIVASYVMLITSVICFLISVIIIHYFIEKENEKVTGTCR